MTNRPRSPASTANQLSIMLNKVLGIDRFPVDVEALALEYSERTAEDPIVHIAGDTFDEFEGMLKSSIDGTKWMIIYNRSGTEGRQRFTVAHEFGHYLLHRQEQRLFQCSSASGSSVDELGRDLEKEADTFAATLLMPLDDFRDQIEGEKPSFELFGHLADRYGVSLTAAALRWIEIAPKRAVLVASRDGFMLWAKSNKAALKSGAIFATRKNTIELPPGALALRDDVPSYGGSQVGSARDWFVGESKDTQVTEMIHSAGQYDYTLTLLLMPESDGVGASIEEDELLEDTYDHFIRNGQYPA